jgi:hypothetical protein
MTEGEPLNTGIRIRPPARKEISMPFPQTLDELRFAGYKFDEHSHCRGCDAVIEWWITPAGKKMPMDVTDSGAVTSHFATCPKAREFRKTKPGGLFA